jgi:AraC family transcriptional regulator, regulatory protein of adaptative response / DNA-3-methyladenine glycosylase II
MTLEPQACFRALVARDRRFDGRFFTAVKTTGIFCRPICPARTPKAVNVEFYPSAAAAGLAGYRPCLRCRPEVAPFSAAWNGTEATVGRALRMIEDGALDEQDLEAFAARLGITGRHLRRLFERWVGASPNDVAQTRRVLFAKALITETRMPIIDVAFAAGFGSVRRFNDAFRKLYRCQPTEVRRGASPVKASHVTITLPFVAPYRWDLFARFVGQRSIEGLESLDGNVYRRQLPEGMMEAEFLEERSKIELRLPLAAAKRTRELTEAARRFFDTRANPEAIAEALRPQLEIPVGLRVPGAWNPFEVAVRAVLGQQISVIVATRLAARVWERCGRQLTPQALLDADIADLGLSARQQATLRELSELLIAGTVQWSDPATLEQVRGIGPWTASYVAMRLSDPDAFPVGDLYLKPHGAGDAFRPWRAYAAMAIWMKETK